MDCAEEVSQLRRALGGVTGIYDLAFDVVNGKMTVEFDQARIAPEAISTAVSKLGMKAVSWNEAPAPSAGFWQMHRRQIFAGASGAALLAGIAIIVWTEGHFSLSLLAQIGRAHV